MASFGTPSADNGAAAPTSSDDLAGYGLPEDSSGNPLGLLDAQGKAMKIINAKSGYQGIALEFEVTDDRFAGAEFSILATKIHEEDDFKARKKKGREWERMGQALRAMGLAVDARQLPVDGLEAVAGVPCRIACSTYNKGGVDNPTIVWGRPKLRSNSEGAEVGFDPDLADDRGSFRDYGCGVLPSE